MSELVEYKIVTIEKKRLMDLMTKLIEASNDDFYLVSLGFRLDHVEGDRLMWVSNAKYNDDNRIVIR